MAAEFGGHEGSYVNDGRDGMGRKEEQRLSEQFSQSSQKPPLHSCAPSVGPSSCSLNKHQTMNDNVSITRERWWGGRRREVVRTGRVRSDLLRRVDVRGTVEVGRVR